MRWSSNFPQISRSRPLARMENCSEARASILMWKSIARAAASKAGPRLADVAGSERRRRDGFGFEILDGMLEFRLRFLSIASTSPAIMRTPRPGQRDAVTTAAGTAALPTSRLLSLFQCTDHCVQRGVEDDRRTSQRVQPSACAFVGCASE